MNYHQLKNSITVPVLKRIPKGYSREAVTAVMMIIAHESLRGEFLHQKSGPACGLINMEPATHDDTWKHGDSIWKNALSLGIINQYQYDHKIHPRADRLNYDLAYNVFMARQRLFMKPAALPESAMDISFYLKNYWNSAFGKAGPTSYYDDWTLWFD